MLDPEVWEAGEVGWLVPGLLAAALGGQVSEPWLKKAELAAKLRVSVRTVERLRLPCTRVGGQNRYHLSEVKGVLRDSGRSAQVLEFPSQPTRDEAA